MAFLPFLNVQYYRLWTDAGSVLLPQPLSQVQHNRQILRQDAKVSTDCYSVCISKAFIRVPTLILFGYLFFNNIHDVICNCISMQVYIRVTEVKVVNKCSIGCQTEKP